MSSSRMHLRFTVGVRCFSTLYLDSVDTHLPFAPEVMLGTSPMWNERVSLSRACFEHKFVFSMEQTNQTAMFSPRLEPLRY